MHGMLSDTDTHNHPMTAALTGPDTAPVSVPGTSGITDSRSDAANAALTCSAAPVQVEGQLPDGEQFYFRARHTQACLGVGGADPSDVPTWEQCEPHTEASYLPAHDGLAILHRLSAMYDAEQGRQ